MEFITFLVTKLTEFSFDEIENCELILTMCYKGVIIKTTGRMVTEREHGPVTGEAEVMKYALGFT